ncbi:putative Trypanosome variant surface glycoprotein (A type) [Trypanosoma vivax]|nr:putative Trypanosome variant surface glycoprotein (A type) [Trypanosoma vivax]
MKGICTWAAAMLFCSSLVARDASGANAAKAGLLLDRAKEICALSTAFKKLATDMEAWKPRIVTRASGKVGDAVDGREEIDRKMDGAVAAYDTAVHVLPHERRADPDTTQAHKMVRRLTFLRHAEMRNAIAKQRCSTAAAVAPGLAAEIDDFMAVFGTYTTSSTHSGCIPSGETKKDSASATEEGCREYTKPGNFEHATLTALTNEQSKFDNDWTGEGNQDKFFEGGPTKTCTLTEATGTDTEQALPTTGVPWAGGLWTISNDTSDGNRPKITWNGGTTQTPATDAGTARKKLDELKDEVG